MFARTSSSLMIHCRPAITPITFFAVLVMAIAGNWGCANIIPPTGGPRDTLPPVLVMSEPANSSLRFSGNKVVLTFNEYVDVQSAFENVVVNPLTKNNPAVTYHFKTVTVKIKDTLEPNTTYSINFGNAIKDVNEGNVYQDFTYVFSTGNALDLNTISGNVVVAETGLLDTTLLVVLHRNMADSAVAKERPRYLAKLNGKGGFQFNYVAPGAYAIYAIPNDYSRHYDDTTKLFAFADQPVSTSDTTPLTLYAYKLEKVDTAKPKIASAPPAKQDANKLLRMQASAETERQGLLNNSLFITFNRPIKTWDTTQIQLTNKDYVPIKNYRIIADTTGTQFTLIYNWPADTQFNLLVNKTAFTDTAGTTLLKNDTLHFGTKRLEDYGSVRLRFLKIDLTKNPVVQLVQNEKIVESSPITQREWTRKLFEPGDYDIRILYDTNANGKWDPGKFFGDHRQPERV